MSGDKLFDFSTFCRHCDSETTDPISASVEGSIPEYAEGSYIFNGIGLTKFGDAEYNLFFDCPAIIQKLVVSSSGCLYSSRYLESGTYTTNKAAGTIAITEMGTASHAPEPKGFMAKMRKMADMEGSFSDNCSVVVNMIGGRPYAFGESSTIQELDLETLRVTEKRSFRKEVGLVNIAAHPVVDKAGNSYIVGQSITLTGIKYTVVKCPSDGSIGSVVCFISPQWRLSPCYMHTLGVTDKYLVIVEQPMVVSMKDAVKEIVQNMPFSHCIKWYSESDVLIHVVDIETQTVVQPPFACSPFIMLHLANCYENDDGDVIMDFPAYDNPIMPSDMLVGKLRAMNVSASENESLCQKFQTAIKRVVLPIGSSPKSQQVRAEIKTLSESGFEHPCINPAYNRQCHRYIYGTGIDAYDKNYGQITKLDVDTGELKTYHQPDYYVSDVLFVPRPGAQEEDDGVIVSLCLVSSKPFEGCLVMLDAATLSRIATVTFTSTAYVTKPSHSTFFALHK